jgi:hypothetical protein
VFFDSRPVFITVQRTVGFEGLKLGIMCEPSDWQFSASEQMCAGQASPLMPIIPGVGWLEIGEGRGGSNGQVDIDRAQWLEFLRPFIALETLCLSKRLVPFIMPVLTEEVSLSLSLPKNYRVTQDLACSDERLYDVLQKRLGE